MDIALNDNRKEFVKNYVGGMDQTNAARKAGYAHPGHEGYRLMQDPAIQAAIQAEIILRVHTEGMTLAVNALINILKNDKLSAGARVDAARLILNKGPLNDAAIQKTHGNSDKSLTEMSLVELE